MPKSIIFDKHSIKAFFAIVLATFLWGTTFAAQKSAAGQCSPFLYNFARFLVGGLVLALIVRSKGIRKISRREIQAGLLLGFLLFAASATQQIGISSTTAGKAGFITSLYIVIVPLLLAFFWREKSDPLLWCSVVIALLGLYFLSVSKALFIERGDAWVLLCSLIWAFHVIAVGFFAKRFSVLRLGMIQCLTNAFLCLLPIFTLEGFNSSSLLSTWFEILYAGLFSAAAAFTIQIAAQRHLPTAMASVLLSFESVFAVLAGAVFLGEELSSRQLLGATLMFTATIIVSLDTFKNSLQK